VQLRLQDAQEQLRKAGMQEGRKKARNLSPRDEENSWFPAFLHSLFLSWEPSRNAWRSWECTQSIVKSEFIRIHPWPLFAVAPVAIARTS
jgi:hypothetical protein